MFRDLVLACVAAIACGLVARVAPQSVSRAPVATRGTVSMKLFDWKRRESDESALIKVDSQVRVSAVAESGTRHPWAQEFRVDNIRGAPGSRKRKMRKGRGIAAGQGATCGFGMRASVAVRRR